MAPDTTDDWKTPSTDALFDALMRLESRDELQRFLRDLCTRHELEELSARWTVVQLLDEAANRGRLDLEYLTGDQARVSRAWLGQLELVSWMSACRIERADARRASARMGSS